MSSKHPVTNTESVTILAGRTSPETTSDYSGSGDPTLVQWRRRPYETHAYPHCTTSETGGSSGSGTVGATNPRSFAIDYPPRPQSPSKPVEDLDFDSKPSATYQSLTDLSRRANKPTDYYTDRRPAMDDRKWGGGGGRACTKCTVFLGLLATTALLFACGAVGIAVYGLLANNEPEEADSNGAKIAELETMLATSTATIRELSATLDDLKRNLSVNVEAKNAQIGTLAAELNRINRSVEEILSPSEAPTNSVPLKVNLTRDCVYTKEHECTVSSALMDLIPVDGNAEGTYPNYSSCDTDAVTITSSGTFIQDAYCAVTNLNTESNPSMATLRHDAGSDSLRCYCFVTAIETRRGRVDCALFVRRCPAVVTVN